MSSVSRLLAHWLHRSNGRAAACVAPEGLRRRVLASVYGEAGQADAHPQPCAPPATPSLRLSAATTGLAIAAAIGLHGLTMPDIRAAKASTTVRTVSSVHGAHAVLQRFGPRAQLTLSGMPQAPIGETFQLWLARTGGASSPTDALFAPTRAGDATVDVPGGLRDVREVIVASAPLGGRSRLTTPPLLRVILARDP
jgi:Anti-sigma-K factor rskA